MNASTSAGEDRRARLAAFLNGVRGEAPLLIGVAPFGMIYGVLALSAGLPVSMAQSMSAIIFAGSSQFIVTQLVGAGAPAMVMFLTVGVVNLRHALYSASLAPHIQHLPVRWKALLAYLLTDEAYAVAILHYEDKRVPLENKHWYFLGAGLALWSTWQLSTAVGIGLGAVVPASWSLDFTLPLTFIALVVPALRGRPNLAAAVVGGITAVAAVDLPYKLGLIVGALLGILAGVLAERIPGSEKQTVSVAPTHSIGDDPHGEQE